MAAAPLLPGPCDWRGVGAATDLRFSPDGRALAVGGGAHVKVFDAATGAHRRPGAWQPGRALWLAFSRDSRWVAAFSGGETENGEGGPGVWRVEDPQQGKLLVPFDRVVSVAFSSDSTRVALLLSGPDAAIRVFRLSDFEPLASLPLRPGEAGSLQFTEDDAKLVLAAPGLAAWSTADWSAVSPPPALPIDFGRPRKDRTKDLSPASARAVGLSGRAVTINGRSLAAPAAGDLTAVAISQDGRLVAAGAESGEVFVWEVSQAFLDQRTTEAALLRRFAAQSARISAVALSHDGGSLAATSDDGSLHVFRVSDGARLWHAQGLAHPLGSPRILAADAASGLLLVTGGRSAAAALDANADRLGPALPAPADESNFGCVGRRDGRAAACVGNYRISVLAAGAEPQMAGMETRVAGSERGGYALSPDGAILLESVRTPAVGNTLDPPSELIAWPLRGGGATRRLAGVDAPVTALAFSGNGARVAGVVRVGAPLRLWDAATGEERTRWTPSPPGPRGEFEAVAISDDGARVAAVGRPTSDLLLATVGGPVRRVRLVARPSGHVAVALSPDGARVATSTPYFPPRERDEIQRGGVVLRSSDGAPLFSLPGGSPGVAFLSNDVLVRGERDGTVSYWCLR